MNVSLDRNILHPKHGHHDEGSRRQTDDRNAGNQYAEICAQPLARRCHCIGIPGSFAAAAAAEAGAKTILIEKFGHDMASGIRDTLAACGSKQQQEDGDDVNKKDAVRYLCNWSQGYTRRSLAQVWADRSGETIDWFTDVLAESGIDFRHEIDEKHDNDNYEVLDVGHSTQYGDEYSEQLTMDAVLKHAEADGLEVQYEITMVKLEKDGNRVTGLIAKNANDEYVRYNASKGVILACGGYSGNETMMNALQPQSVEQTCINYSKPGAKGDGIKACLWAGAIMDQTHTSMIFDRGAIKPDQVGEYGKANDGALFWMGSQPFLKVNLNGERFMNEYMPYDLVLHAAASQPYHTYCTVWDSKYPEDVERFATHGCSRLYPHVNGTAPVFPIEYIEGMNADLQDQGYIVQADTVEELAEAQLASVGTSIEEVREAGIVELADPGFAFGTPTFKTPTEKFQFASAKVAEAGLNPVIGYVPRLVEPAEGEFFLIGGKQGIHSHTMTLNLEALNAISR